MLCPAPQTVALLEGAISSSPPSSLQPSLLTNLSTSHELDVAGGEKKMALLPLLAQHVGDGFPLACLSLK